MPGLSRGRSTTAAEANENPETLAHKSIEQVADHYCDAIATGRFTTPEEVADLVLFLASDRAADITGADFVIDGDLVTTL